MSFYSKFSFFKFPNISFKRPVSLVHISLKAAHHLVFIEILYLACTQSCLKSQCTAIKESSDSFDLIHAVLW
jgi:hypothetical protein